MKIGMLGTGVVGRTLASALVRKGHQVRMGSRTEGHDGARDWVHDAGAGASHGSFADAASFGEEVVFNCTAGTASLAALEMAGGSETLDGKILIDVANPLDFSRGMPPSLTITGGDSLGERIQQAYPGTRVVKTLNTVTARLMVDPGLIAGPHHLFICGEDAEAKARVGGWLHEWLGWAPERLVDLGGISAARGTEAYVLLWAQLMLAEGTPVVTVAVRKGEEAAET